MQTSLIITAGGKSVRFWKDAPRDLKRLSRTVPSKLFLPLAGRPVLFRTLDAFRGMNEIREIVLVCPKEDRSWIRAFFRHYHEELPRLVAGGKTRSESVYRGLKETDPSCGRVLVHDGARPFVTAALVRRLLKAGRGSRAGALLARAVVPTLKQQSARGGWAVKTVDRRFLFEAETPQLVPRKLLLEAYRRVPQAFMATDESSLIEAAGEKMKLVSHTSWNPKITTAADFRIAEAFLLQSEGPLLRTGLGKDLHRLVAGRPLMLGGIRVPSERGALGHSDGDAVLHAVIDGLLGAAGLGDIGEWFSDRSKKYRGIASALMLNQVLEAVRSKGWSPYHVDCVISLEKPKLGKFKDRMRRKMAALLGLKADEVSVKAKTAEGLGRIGEGEAVACEALVSVRRRP